MATTSLWRVKGWLGKVVVYIENPDKTENPRFFDLPGQSPEDAQGLADVIAYAANPDKTTPEQDVPLQRFVSGVNCHPTTARPEMMAVKKRFGKEDGTVAYYGYQSFAPGEVTPEVAHEIGVKLAQALWGDKYQVLVATHLDKPDYYQPDEVDDILSALEKAPLKWKTITYLLIDTGARRGEILGLRDENIDLDTGLIVIDHALLSTKSKGVYEGETKNSRVRALYLAPQSIELMKKWKAERLRMRLIQGDRWIDSGYFFTQDDGNRMHPDTITDWLNKFSKDNDLPHIHPHAFRHPYVKHTTKKYFLQKQKSQTIKHTAMVWDSGFFNS